MNKTQLLFLVILIEGYVVLASELIAIRSLVPFVGSGAETISIIISAVLLPLAVGYHVGGNAFKNAFSKAKNSNKKRLSIRKILQKNIITSLIILTIGLSYIFQEIFFGLLSLIGFHNRLLQTSLYSILFLSYPVFLLGQTVPLISNYFSRAKLSEITGKMLFFSTTGSFLGSVFSTIVLMTFVGVHNTVIFTLSLLCVLILLLVRRVFSFETLLCLVIFMVLFSLNSNTAMQSNNIVLNSSYNIVKVTQDEKNQHKNFEINHSISSVLDKDNNAIIPILKYIEENFINPTLKNPKEPLEFLIIGAGGFTVGIHDKHNHYTFIDIDPRLKDTAEKYFLPEQLSPNKKFIASSARAFLNSEIKKYDMIFIDVYTNKVSIPMECTTKEFFEDVKKLLKDNGVVIANVIASPTFSDLFSVRYNNTFRSVFPNFSRHVVHSISDINPWVERNISYNPTKTLIYMYFNNKYAEDTGVYTDDKNSYSLDRP